MKQPLVLILDDDPSFSIVLSRFLDRCGISSLAFQTRDAFVSRLQFQKPQLCFIDLNLTHSGEGFEVVRHLRNTLKMNVPIIIVSSTDDPPSFLKALQEGADDYIVKPYAKHVVISKVTRFIQTEELRDASTSLLPMNWTGLPVNLSVDFKVCGVDEYGIHLQCEHLLMKDMVLKFEGKLIEDITGGNKACLMMITHSEFDPDSKKYRYYAAFDSTNIAILTLVRYWLKGKAFAQC